MAGLTQFGFQRKTFTEIRDSIRDRISSSIGQTFNFSSDSHISKLVDNTALEMDELWQVFEGVDAARKINGAEGVYLDELLSSIGVFREGASKATDTVMIGVDQTAPASQTIDNTYTFTGSGFDFAPVSDTFVGILNTSALFIPLTDNVGLDNNISITLTGREGSSVDFSIVTTGATTESEWEDILQSLVNTCRDSLNLTPSSRNKCFYVAGEGAYIGFTATSKVVDRVGINLTFNITPNAVGAAEDLIYTRYSPVSVIAEEAGFKSFSFGDISSISPQPTSFVSVRNIGSTFNGTESETDAAYRLRAQRIRLQPNNSTRLSLEASLLAVNGISQVKVFENPTPTDRPEALANTFNTVVLGSDASTITDLILNKKPINTLTSGSEFEDKSLPGGLTERVYYTPATQQQYSIRVEYKTRDNLPLTSSQLSTISSEFQSIPDVAEIGDKIENDALKGIVYGIGGYTKLDRVVVKVKGPADGSFLVKDITLSFDQYLVIPTTGVTTVQVFV